MATAEARDGEMDERISHHRRARPAGWLTLELEGGTVLTGLPASAGLALLDCFTVYLSNLMATKGLDWPVEEEDLMAEEEVLRLMEECEGRPCTWWSACTRSGDHHHRLQRGRDGRGAAVLAGRIFRDLAGRLNQRLAERADGVPGRSGCIYRKGRKEENLEILENALRRIGGLDEEAMRAAAPGRTA